MMVQNCFTESAMTLDGFNTHTQEMENVSITESVLFPLKKGVGGETQA